MPENILTSVEFQMSLLMFVALAGYLLAYGINQSAVVGIIIAGVIVGPSLLGFVTYTDFVSSLAHLGAVVLLFTIGLEFELKDITKPRYLVIALAGIVIPWVGGYFLAEAFGFSFTASIFIGTASTATSIAITANVLEEMGKLDTSAARAIMGAAIIDDILALLALTVSEQLVTGSLESLTILVGLGKAVAFLVIGAIPVRILLRRVMLWFDDTRVARKFPQSIFIFAMMIAFLYSIGAEAAGLSPVVGSFLAGVAFASMELKQGAIFHRGSEHLKIIFASIFFISLGVLLDVHVIDGHILVFILALTAVAAATKIIGCGLPARLFGNKLRDSAIIGVGMMPRGEVAMIVALIGLSKGWIQQDTYAALVTMSLLTTIIPPLLLRNWLYKKDKK
ncbi:MAG: cation:proton antiporter [Dehalococcoidales bacterium]|nr:cation:proton antiporter [Dehalococcoidales bacterium]